MTAPHPDIADRSVVLTGFMATGKSTIGRLLARRLGFDFVDTDELIEREHGPIPDIFAERGEAAFRAIERDVAAKLAERDRLVVSTGGRLMLDLPNITALTRRGRVFCLVASPDTVLARVASGDSPTERPLLAVDDPRARIAELLAERDAGYRRFPQIATDTTSPDVLADELAALVQTEPELITVGDVDVVVGVGVLPLVLELTGLDGPAAVVTDEAGRRYLPLLPELTHEPGDAATIVALGGSAAIAAATANTDVARRGLVICPTDVDGLFDAVSAGPRSVVVDVATLQAIPRTELADLGGASPSELPADLTRPGALGALRSLVAGALRRRATDHH